MPPTPMMGSCVRFAVASTIRSALRVSGAPERPPAWLARCNSEGCRNSRAVVVLVATRPETPVSSQTSISPAKSWADRSGANFTKMGTGSAGSNSRAVFTRAPVSSLNRSRACRLRSWGVLGLETLIAT